MPEIQSETLPNGLPLHRVGLPGTRATTILVAFDAGARTERPEENGMAHFLEHLVFKGGELYDDYRKVNETAERMGASLNAYTSHDLVAFHITCRAEVAIVALRERRWAGERGGAFIVGNLDHVPADGEAGELLQRFPSLPAPESYDPAPALSPRTLVEERDTNQSHLRMAYRPSIDVTAP